MTTQTQNNPLIRILQRAVVLLAIVAIAPSAEAARKVYVLIAADEADSEIGQHAATDASLINSLFSANIRGEERQIVRLAGHELNQNGILGRINSLPADADDAIVFYYSGHGATASGQRPFLVTGNKSNWIDRDLVSQTLRTRGTGLAVLITDACANFTSVDPDQSRKALARIDMTSPLFRKLFFQTNGFVDVNSCSRDETAATHPDALRGSVFTSAVHEELTALSGLQSPTWNSILDGIADRTASEFGNVFADGVTVELADGGFTNQRSQTVWRKSVDVRPWSPGSGSGAEPLPQAPQSSSEFEITINAQTGMVTSVRIDRTWNPNTGQTTEQRFPPQSLGKAEFVKAGDGTPYWRHEGMYVQANVGGKPVGANPVGPGPADPPGGGGPSNQRTLLVRVRKYNGGGLEIGSVLPGSPVNRCLGADGRIYRLEEGDVILRVNGQSTNSVGQLRAAMNKAGQRTLVEALDVKTGFAQTFTVRLAGQSAHNHDGEQSAAKPENLRVRFGVSVGEHSGPGVVLIDVITGSPATRVRDRDGRTLRLEAGDVITHVDGRQVNSEQEFAAAVAKAPQRLKIRVVNVQDNRRYEFDVRLNH